VPLQGHFDVVERAGVARFRPAAWVALALVGLAGCRTPDGPKPGVPAEPAIIMRVRLLDASGGFDLAIDGRYVVVNGAERSSERGSLPRTRVQVRPFGFEIGDRLVFTAGSIDIVPDTYGGLWVEGRRYCGFLRLHRIADNQVLVVNHVPVEDYLKGVLGAELPRSFQIETYKAQAICARTFALYEKLSRDNGQRPFDVSATEASQVYHGIEVHSTKSLQAVEATRGIVLVGETAKGWKIFPAFFSSTCGGVTQAGRYLAAIDPDFRPLQGGVTCSGCSLSPKYHWAEQRIPAAEVVERLRERGAGNLSGLRQVYVAKLTPSGRIAEIELTDPAGRTVSLPGERFRLIVGSRKMLSTWCEPALEGDELVLRNGRGFGHGVGLCQWGAEGMARAGATATEILRHYYPGARLVLAYK